MPSTSNTHIDLDRMAPADKRVTHAVNIRVTVLVQKVVKDL
jgi:hypothetical protein